MAWDKSPSTNVIAQYKVYYGVAKNTYTNSVSAGTNLTVSVSNLVVGATYYFAATAVDTFGLESDYSTEVSTQIILPNQAPTLNALANVTINESSGLRTVNLSGISSGATGESQTLVVTSSSSNTGLIPNPTVNYTSPSASGSISFTPVPYAYGSAVVSVTVNDGGASNNIVTRTFTVTVNPVNQPPTLNNLANVTINENATLQTVNLTGIGTGAANESQTLTVTATSSNTGLIPNPTLSYTSPNTSGSISFTPVANAYGVATITVTVNDGASSDNTVTRTFTVTVNSVNQAPTLNTLANVTINENATLQTVSLTGIGTGAANESQTLSVTASSSNTGLIPNPTVSYTSPSASGSISFTPVANANGAATITVTVNDGATSNNIVTRTFTVTVNSVNQPPTLNNLANVTISENATLQTVNLTGIGTGAANESQTLAVTATSSNTGLIPNPTVSYTSPNASGSISFTPVAYANGAATITVTINDGGASNNIVTRTFTVTVTPVNQPPTLNNLANVTINENATLQTVSLTGIGTGAANESQTLAVTATSSNTGLIPNPTVSYTSPSASGSISFRPVTDANGSATITVTVNDGGASNNIVTRTFTVTVNHVNEPPTISAIADRMIAANTSTPAIAFTIADAETSAASLAVSGSSDNTSLVPTSRIVFSGNGGNRTVVITPTTGQTGSANITITVSDGTDTANRVFQLTVRSRPAAPGNLQVVGTQP
ncbi:MAG TPA: Ig-like domain-containing protein [Candidatus Paceibacterota bacterium]|nr:Ig-like domain-containing protein [Verrucomicrobiota bacterium]HSA09282.1 Ig-like domain-containing protein [Candidatus Paceibacterota bacterium]